jgi:hypothetical protein
MREPPHIASRQCGVFSWAQAASEGWTRAALRWAVRQGDMVPLRPGVLQLANLEHLDPFARRRWRHAGPAIAAALTTPGAVASHSTAAILRDLPLAFVPRMPCVSVVPWHTGQIRRTHVHRTSDQPLRLPVAGISCMTAARAALDLAREHGVHAGVVPLDFALRWRLTDEDELQRTLAHCRRWPGVVAAREAVAAADWRSESPLESLSRLKLAAAGVPPAELQTSIGDEHGRLIARVDFFWPQFGVVGEVDGSVKYDADKPASLVQEKWRQEDLERTELIVVRWGADDLRRFDRVAERLHRAFRRGAARPAADHRWSILERAVRPPVRTLTPSWS